MAPELDIRGHHTDDISPALTWLDAVLTVGKRQLRAMAAADAAAGETVHWMATPPRLMVPICVMRGGAATFPDPHCPAYRALSEAVWGGHRASFGYYTSSQSRPWQFPDEFIIGAGTAQGVVLGNMAPMNGEQVVLWPPDVHAWTALDPTRDATEAASIVETYSRIASGMGTDYDRVLATAVALTH